VLRFMERSTILYLKKKGWSNAQIAEFTGHHRDTIARVLREPVDRTPAPRERHSAIALFDEEITQWLAQGLPSTRMLELARQHAEHPYQGGNTAFYTYVRRRRRELGQWTPRDAAVRFEGLPGEFLQIDWGEVRDFPFSQAEQSSQTRYFFAARLKYSRAVYVSFQCDMREETLLRCLIACFQAFGGVPWVVTTDNMKTVVLGRDEQHQPIWHPAYQRLAVEFGFHPEACSPAAGNQKGAVENLVKYVKSNFLAGRSFHDDADLDAECQQWVQRVNQERPNAATGVPPAVRLQEEQPRFGPLPDQATDYGFFESVVVSREGLVTLETNRYSVPVTLLGQALTARIHQQRIELFQGTERVAVHPRHRGHQQRIMDPAHFEAAFVSKPRARVMVYRDWLVGLSPVVARYISEVCRRRRDEMSAQVSALYDLAQHISHADLLSAMELATEQGGYGVEYIQAILARPPAPPVPANVVPLRQTVERDLEQYERYVANRDLLLASGGEQ
jgi:transposase